MEVSYREVVPHGQMSIWIECFWTQTIEEPTCKIILPDGCADIVFVTSKRIVREAKFVGVMTKPRPVSLDAGDSLCGIRFHPGMAIHRCFALLSSRVAFCEQVEQSFKLDAAVANAFSNCVVFEAAHRWFQTPGRIPAEEMAAKIEAMVKPIFPSSFGRLG